MDGSNWEQVYIDNAADGYTTPNRWEWERGTNPHFVMVNSDISLVRNLTGEIGAEGEVGGCQFKCNRRNCALPACPHAPETLDIVAEYKFENAVWLEDFESAFKVMLETGQYDTGGPCESPPCTAFWAEARRNLRG